MEVKVIDQRSQARAGAIYRSYMTQGGEVHIDAHGWGEFSCFANAVQVWVPAA